MEPEVRYLLLCDDVRPDPNNYHRFNIYGLITTIHAHANPPFPALRSSLCVLVLLTGGQGTGELRLRIFHEWTHGVVVHTQPRQVRFVGDPAAILGATFRLRACSFPEAGLSWVEVIYADAVPARQKLWLKA